MIAGGSEAAITPMGVGGFGAMRALSTRNDEPERASRPFDKERDGFVIGEGSGVLVSSDPPVHTVERLAISRAFKPSVLEEMESDDLADLFELEMDKLANQYEMQSKAQQQGGDKQIDELRTMVAAKQVTIEMDPSARAWLAARGFDRVFGARPMARLIERVIKKPLSEMLLFGTLGDGGVVRVALEGDEIKLVAAN